MTAFADIVEAITTALAGLAGGEVHRGYPWPMAEDVNEQIFVRPEVATSERSGIAGGPVDWRTTVVVQIRCRYTPDTESADASVDALLAAAYAALAGVTLPGLEDLVPGPQVSWDYSGADTNVMAASFTVDVLHRTAAATLTAWT